MSNEQELLDIIAKYETQIQELQEYVDSLEARLAEKNINNMIDVKKVEKAQNSPQVDDSELFTEYDPRDFMNY